MFFNLERGRTAAHPFDSQFWDHMKELVFFSSSPSPITSTKR